MRGASLMPEPSGERCGLCAPADAARTRLIAASGRIANFIGWTQGDWCDAHTSLPEKWILRRHIRSLGLRAAEGALHPPGTIPRVQLIKRQAYLDNEIVIQETRNDLCRCGWEGTDDGGLDPLEPCDLVRRQLDDDVFDDPRHALLSQSGDRHVIRTACHTAAAVTPARLNVKKT